MLYPVPAYVERDPRKFLECGILVHEFARARCEKCGQDFLVAYSCKGRRVCASCNTRRMVEAAAHMVEHVFAAVAVRQWVVVFPKRERCFLNLDAGYLNRVAGIMVLSVSAPPFNLLLTSLQQILTLRILAVNPPALN